MRQAIGPLIIGEWGDNKCGALPSVYLGHHLSDHGGLVGPLDGHLAVLRNGEGLEALHGSAALRSSEWLELCR